MSAPMRDASATDFDDVAKQIGFAGMPVKTVIYADGTPQITTTVTSIAHTPLPPDAFAVPAGYTRMKMPGFGGGKEWGVRAGGEVFMPPSSNGASPAAPCASA